MSKYTVSRVVLLANDVLLVEGERDGVAVTARGWASATTNFYPPDTYRQVTAEEAKSMGLAVGELYRVEGAQPRAMTEAEREAYAEALLAEQNPGPPEVEVL